MFAFLGIKEERRKARASLSRVDSGRTGSLSREALVRGL